MPVPIVVTFARIAGLLEAISTSIIGFKFRQYIWNVSEVVVVLSSFHNFRQSGAVLRVGQFNQRALLQDCRWVSVLQMRSHLQAAAEYGESCGIEACPSRGCCLSSLSKALCHQAGLSHAPQSGALLQARIKHLIRVLSSNIFFPYFANIDTVLAQMSWKKQLSRGWWSSVMGLGVAVSVTLWPSTRQPSQIMLSQGTSSLMGIPVSTAISSAQQKMPLSAISTSATVRNTTSCFEMFRSWFW